MIPQRFLLRMVLLLPCFAAAAAPVLAQPRTPPSRASPHARALAPRKPAAANTCPLADPGPTQMLECTGFGGTMVRLDATRSRDPDGDPIACGWGFGATMAVTDTFFKLGYHEVNLSVSDGRCVDTVMTAVMVADTTPPVLTCPPPVTAECREGGAHATFAPATAMDLCQTYTKISSDERSFYAMGTSLVTFSAVDGSGNIAHCTSSVTVVDTQAPVVACNAPRTVMAGDSAVFAATASDSCCAATVRVLAVDCGQRDGSVGGACPIASTGDRVRVEGARDGQRLAWTVEATDCQGNKAVETCAVEVVPAAVAKGRRR